MTQKKRFPVRPGMTLVAALLIAACTPKAPAVSPAEALLERLNTSVAYGKILYGHQDDLCYGHAWKVEDWRNDSVERSDIKDVAGKYPAIVGFDLGGIEMGDSLNLDGVPFGLIRKAAQAHVERGGIVTLSWHPRNPYTGSDAWDVSSNQVVASILPGGEKHDLFCLWLDRVAEFVGSLEVPVIFRPWHECSESWFWWGKDLCSEQEYIDLFRFTRKTLEEKGVKDLLWCYSPNGPFSQEKYLSRYPGDEYVELLGADLYMFKPKNLYNEMAGVYFQEQLSEMLATLDAIGKEHGKLICLSETGLESINDPKWWTIALYPAIKEYPVAYVLTWRNAWDRPDHFYAPWDGFSWAKDFVEFCNREQIELL